MIVPVATLYQPYASLLFRGGQYQKLHETRPKPLPPKYVGQWVGIHAAKFMPSDEALGEALWDLCNAAFGPGWRDRLPRSAIIGAVKFTGSFPTLFHEPGSEADRLAGNWGAGRCAYPVDPLSPYIFAPVIQAKGRQGWWRADLPLPEAV